MKVSSPERQPVAEWRPGVRTRLHVGASTGAAGLCMAEQWVEPGAGAPAHRHPGVEEVLTVLAGAADVWVEDERAVAGPGTSVLVPGGSLHGFTNRGDATLHVLAIFAAAAPPAVYEDDPEVVFEIGGTGGTAVDPTRVRRPRAAGR